MLDRERMPQHVAIIMDGNGRWAKKRGLPRLAGHNAGMKAMKKIVDHSDKLGIKYLTVYAFSTENWKRSQEEVSACRFSLETCRWLSSRVPSRSLNSARL